MKKTLTLLSILLVVVVQAQTTKPNYTDGVFFVNEDWYGHQNGSINFLSTEGEWTYHVFKKSNPGKELGCTSQHGTLYGDKMYIVSKQERDPGSGITGSRFTVCDATSLVCLHEFQTIAVNSQGKSIADGRSFLGVNEKKGYIGTSNGIWVYDIEKGEIGEQIEGTGNPNATGYGQLYHAQIGTMVRTEDYVFAVHQQDGLKVIDPETDTLITTIAAPTYIENGQTKSRGFGSIVQSKDGNLWISMAANTTGNGATLPYLLQMNPYSFEVDTLHIPIQDGVEEVPNSWYAWTADGFCSSTQENKIYWSGNNKNSWFKGRRIFCYDIDKQEFSTVFDFEEMPGNWILYGAGFRIHPVSNEIYCSLYHEFQDPTYQSVRISKQGELLQEYPMITNYWFPAMPVFPDVHEPVVSAIPAIQCPTNGKFSLGLQPFVTDADNLPFSIVKSVVGNTTPELFEAHIKNGKLQITAVANKEGSGVVKVQFNSNGKLAYQDITVQIGSGSAQLPQVQDVPCQVFVQNNTLYAQNCQGYQLTVYTSNGLAVKSLFITDSQHQEPLSLPKGIYLIKGSNASKTYTSKLIIQ